MVETENPLGFVADTFAPTLNLREAVPIMNPQRNNVLVDYNRILLTIQDNAAKFEMAYSRLPQTGSLIHSSGQARCFTSCDASSGYSLKSEDQLKLLFVQDSTSR
jgi:hypothetical protein